MCFYFSRVDAMPDGMATRSLWCFDVGAGSRERFRAAKHPIRKTASQLAHTQAQSSVLPLRVKTLINKKGHVRVMAAIFASLMRLMP
jgi:hypothetical protein